MTRQKKAKLIDATRIDLKIAIKLIEQVIVDDPNIARMTDVDCLRIASGDICDALRKVRKVLVTIEGGK